MILIKILDSKCDRYTIGPGCRCLGRMWDNDAEEILVEKPIRELNHACTMIVMHEGETIDHILVGNEPIPVKNTLSQFDNVDISFWFSDINGYSKSSEQVNYTFGYAPKPEQFTPVPPQQISQIETLIANGYTGVRWNVQTDSIEFLNAGNSVVGTLSMSNKQDVLVSGTNIKTINNESILGEGNLEIGTITKTSELQNDGEDGTSPYATKQYVDDNSGKIDKIYLNNQEQSIVNKEVHLEVNKSTVGLNNVDNTSDLNKPVSTAQQAAINTVANSIGNGTITINQNGVLKGTFTTNQNSNTTINLEKAEVIDNYNELNNKPQINNITLSGNKSSSDLGLATSSQGEKADTALQPEDVDAALNILSTNPVQNKVIAELIPSQANVNNKLADKDFVNSSISTNTANFIGTFANISALNAYSGTVTNNDYAFVINSVITDNGNDWSTFTALDAYNKTLLTNFDYAWVINGTKFDLYRFDIVGQRWDLRVQNTDKDNVTLNNAFNRYKATVLGSTTTWDYEFTLNNSSFTADQWATINSGLTRTDKTKLDGIESGAQVNTIASISAGGSALTPDANKNVDIPLASNSTFGVIKGSNSYGVYVSPSGVATTTSATNAEIDAKSNDYKCIVPKNLDYAASTTYLKGNSAPTTSTVGFEGQLYLNSADNVTYQCTAVTAQGTDPETYTYTWKKLANVPIYREVANANIFPPTNVAFEYPGQICVVQDTRYGRYHHFICRQASDGSYYWALLTPNTGTGTDSISLGQDATATGYGSIAYGAGAKATAKWAIQIGAGTNSTAQTFNVGFGGGSGNYQLLNSSGKIPQARISDCLTGSSAPTTSTAADYIGQLYRDTTNNKTYQCTAVTGDGGDPEVFTYTWAQLVRVTDYGSQTVGGVVKVWTSTNADNELGLNISTE